jgi:hypothetical protein
VPDAGSADVLVRIEREARIWFYDFLESERPFVRKVTDEDVRAPSIRRSLFNEIDFSGNADFA